MISHTRRKFLQRMSMYAAGLPLALSTNSGMSEAISKENSNGNPRIEDIELHEVLIPFHDYNASWLFKYRGLGIQHRTIYIIRTDNGQIGYGESWGTAPEKETFKCYIGSSLYDVINSTAPTAIQMAIYDVLGKSLEFPMWKLLGQKIRSWVPVSSWTVSQPPKAMAKEVINVSKRGYRWLKYHVDVLQDVIDQTAEMQKVAPPWFKVHYDFDGFSSMENIDPVLKELEKFSIAGRIEDPLHPQDQTGYHILREEYSIPVIYSRGSLETALLERFCDSILLGGSINRVRKFNSVAEVVNIPFLLQQIGGGITQAFVAHLSAVFKMATLDHSTASNLWKDDIINENIPVVNGLIQVLNKPGLGITLNEEKLEKYSNQIRPKQPRFLVRTRYKGGSTLYFRHNADSEGATQRFLAFRHGEFHASPGLAQDIPPADIPGPLPGYNNHVVTDFWEEDSNKFEKLWSRTESGPVWVP